MNSYFNITLVDGNNWDPIYYAISTNNKEGIEYYKSKNLIKKTHKEFMKVHAIKSLFQSKNR
jgi:hypothetical protein